MADLPGPSQILQALAPAWPVPANPASRRGAAALGPARQPVQLDNRMNGALTGVTSRFYDRICPGLEYPGRVIVMGPAAAVIAFIVLVVGALMGWHANRAHAAHGDLRATRGRLPGYRRTRLRSGLFAIAMLVLAVIVVRDLIRH